MVTESIKKLFDEDLNKELKAKELTERIEYRRALKEFVINMKDEDEGDDN